jgi:hypothetical protein
MIMQHVLLLLWFSKKLAMALCYYYETYDLFCVRVQRSHPWWLAACNQFYAQSTRWAFFRFVFLFNVKCGDRPFITTLDLALEESQLAFCCHPLLLPDACQNFPAQQTLSWRTSILLEICPREYYNKIITIF